VSFLYITDWSWTASELGRDEGGGEKGEKLSSVYHR